MHCSRGCSRSCSMPAGRMGTVGGVRQPRAGVNPTVRRAGSWPAACTAQQPPGCSRPQRLVQGRSCARATAPQRPVPPEPQAEQVQPSPRDGEAEERGGSHGPALPWQCRAPQPSAPRARAETKAQPSPAQARPPFRRSLLGARRASATMPQFQGSGAVPKRAEMEGTPNTCGGGGGARVQAWVWEGWRGWRKPQARGTGWREAAVPCEGALGRAGRRTIPSQPPLNDAATVDSAARTRCPEVTSGRCTGSAAP